MSTGHDYSLTRLGGGGDWVYQSARHEQFYVCPNCFATSNQEFLLQRTDAKADVPAYEQYECRRCNNAFTTHPDELYHRP